MYTCVCVFLLNFIWVILPHAQSAYQPSTEWIAAIRFDFERFWDSMGFTADPSARNQQTPPNLVTSGIIPIWKVCNDFP